MYTGGNCTHLFSSPLWVHCAYISVWHKVSSRILRMYTLSTVYLENKRPCMMQQWCSCLNERHALFLLSRSPKFSFSCMFGILYRLPNLWDKWVVLGQELVMYQVVQLFLHSINPGSICHRTCLHTPICRLYLVSCNSFRIHGRRLTHRCWRNKSYRHQWNNGHNRRQQTLEPIEKRTTAQEGQAVVPLLLVLDWEIENWWIGFVDRLAVL